jgi:hypothetical protein
MQHSASRLQLGYRTGSRRAPRPVGLMTLETRIQAKLLGAKTDHTEITNIVRAPAVFTGTTTSRWLVNDLWRSSPPRCQHQYRAPQCLRHSHRKGAIVSSPYAAICTCNDVLTSQAFTAFGDHLLICPEYLRQVRRSWRFNLDHYGKSCPSRRSASVDRDQLFINRAYTRLQR